MGNYWTDKKDDKEYQEHMMQEQEALINEFDNAEFIDTGHVARVFLVSKFQGLSRVESRTFNTRDEAMTWIKTFDPQMYYYIIMPFDLKQNEYDDYLKCEEVEPPFDVIGYLSK